MLLTARNLEKWYGPRLLFTGITLGLAPGERIGLIGANGSGKSTLLRIFAGLEQPDEGEIVSMRQLRVGFVPQEDSFRPDASCIDLVAAAYDDHLDDHERHTRAQIALSRAGFPDASALARTLSGGWRKRLAILRQAVAEPQLLLMDEPTNHLDIEGILWLEDLIAAGAFASLVVSHDRRFLDSFARRIIELGHAYPDGFLSHNGTYCEFLAKREEFLAAQQGRQQALASGVRREIEWLSRKAKARTTKAKGRIEKAHEMMADLADLKTRNAAQAGPAVEFTSSDRKTRKLVEFKKVSKSFAGRQVFRDVSFILSPGKRLGLLGPNGSGKSTLIKLISGELAPDSGAITRADGLRVVVFDQHREQLDPAEPLRHALSPTGDHVKFQGASQHINGWAQRFLFHTDQLDTPVGELSGGEQARVLIARLMLREADILILDEPTNDLDIPTLDVLQSSLESFPGALVLVTHDRYLLDQISSEILALDPAGIAAIYPDLAQWERFRDEAREAQSAARRVESNRAATSRAPSTGAFAETSTSASAGAAAKPARRLKWSEQRELESIEADIAAAEGKVASLQAQVADPATSADHIKMRDACTALGAAQQEVERLYSRWAELDSITA